MINFTDWGLIDYPEALDRQERLFEQKIAQKRAGKSPSNDLIFCEHPHVYTLGKHGKEENMLLSEEQLQAVGAKVYRIARGGDITYHGQGQIVGYPIVDLEQLHIGLKEYIYRLEQAVIQTIAQYGIQGERLQGATGVWVDAQTQNARKICAIGVRASRFVTMHGFALNVNTDLRYFQYINPCGFTDKGVTSIAQETGQRADIEEVKSKLKEELMAALERA